MLSVRNPLAIASHGRKCINKSFWLAHGGFGDPSSKNCNQKSMADNQSDLFMHVLSMSQNGQVATNDCNGQVFF